MVKVLEAWRLNVDSYGAGGCHLYVLLTRSLLTFWIDKKERRCGFTVFPKRLYVSMLGGSPAAMFARQHLRHKTRSNRSDVALRILGIRHLQPSACNQTYQNRIALARHLILAIPKAALAKLSCYECQVLSTRCGLISTRSLDFRWSKYLPL